MKFSPTVTAIIGEGWPNDTQHTNVKAMIAPAGKEAIPSETFKEQEKEQGHSDCVCITHNLGFDKIFVIDRSRNDSLWHHT